MKKISSVVVLIFISITTAYGQYSHKRSVLGEILSSLIDPYYGGYPYTNYNYQNQYVRIYFGSPINRWEYIDPNLGVWYMGQYYLARQVHFWQNGTNNPAYMTRPTDCCTYQPRPQPEAEVSIYTNNNMYENFPSNTLLWYVAGYYSAKDIFLWQKQSRDNGYLMTYAYKKKP